MTSFSMNMMEVEVEDILDHVVDATSRPQLELVRFVHSTNNTDFEKLLFSSVFSLHIKHGTGLCDMEPNRHPLFYSVIPQL
jgi:hypothetical protein